jgi:hypothetical protein
MALALLAPLLVQTGHPLGRDLVFVPTQPWTDAVLGLGDAVPRAVPLDALMSGLTQVVDGGIVARVLLPLTLAAAGWGAQLFLRDAGLPARVAAGALAVWNPFVVERLALGQWALLVAYAAIPWIFLASARYRRDGGLADLGAVTLWAAAASLTPTGGLLALVAAAAGGVARTGRSALLLAVVATLQAPWLAAAVVRTGSSTSAAEGVAAFAPDSDAPGGAVVAMLGLGGTWDDAVRSATRETWLAAAAAIVVVLVLVTGRPALRRLLGADLARRWWWPAIAGLVLALLTAMPIGQDALRWAVAEVPGAGLLRDGQKFLAPLALLTATALGALTQRVMLAMVDVEAEIRSSVALVLLAVPFLLLPDATTVTWPTVRPVTFPESFDDVVDAVDEGPDSATVVTLPWRSYRLFSWGNEQTSSDPALRLLDADVVVDDNLQVGNVLVAGEGERASEIGRALDAARPADVLGPLGVTWVVVYPDDPEAGSLDLSGLEPVVRGGAVELYRVPGEVSPSAGPGHGARVVALVALGVFLALTLLGAALRMLGPRAAASRRRGPGEEDEHGEAPV